MPGTTIFEDYQGETHAAADATFDVAIDATIDANDRLALGAGIDVADYLDNIVIVDDHAAVSRSKSSSRSGSKSGSKYGSRSRSNVSMSRSTSRSRFGSASKSGSRSSSKSASRASMSRSVSRSKEYSRSGSASRDESRSRSREDSRSGSASRDNSRSRSREDSRSGSTSRSQSRVSESRSRSRSTSQDKSGSRSRSTSQDKSGSRSRSRSSVPLNTCNDCDPRLPDTYTFAAVGTGNDWSGQIDWVVYCVWTNKLDPTDDWGIDWDGLEENWIASNPSGGRQYNGGTDPCDPTGVYTPNGAETGTVTVS